VLVTSCPICYKVFKEDYNLDIEVLHHTQYLLRLVDQGKLKLMKIDKRMVYHDPCELGRGSGIYEEPRILISKIAELIPGANERTDSICCGGSLGNTEISSGKRHEIKNLAIESLLINQPEIIVTACPLCKKTLQNDTEIQVADISEIVVGALAKKEPVTGHQKREVNPVVS
jgi:Fe-S oxidoreductase